MDNIIYISDAELEQLGYYKNGLIWIIAEVRYRLVEATKNGHRFVKL
jgi:hypothetical protein